MLDFRTCDKHLCRDVSRTQKNTKQKNGLQMNMH